MPNPPKRPKMLLAPRSSTNGGYRVIRFWNEQINHEMEDVLETIYLALADY
jgi:very-short-patch-repair endonuclease